MPADFGYINARIKGRHGQLLGEAAFHELLDLPDFPAFAAWLETSAYSADWQLAKARYQGLEAAEWALGKNFGGTTQLLLRIAEGAPARMITVLLRRWDLANLLAVVRGIARDWSGADIAGSLGPAGSLGGVRLKELTEQRSLRAVADTLATWQDGFAQPLGGCLARFEQGKELAPVELALQAYYYREAFRALRGAGHSRGLLRELLRREVDLANAKALRRLLDRTDQDGTAAQDYCIPGGAVLTPAAFAGLLAPRDRSRQLRALRATPFYQLLSAAGDRVAQENALDRALWSDCARLYRADPLGIDVAIGYLWRKYYELINLRLLARAKWYGLPSAAVRPQLFLG